MFQLEASMVYIKIKISRLMMLSDSTTVGTNASATTPTTRRAIEMIFFTVID
jgi:hypothetical protein